MARSIGLFLVTGCWVIMCWCPAEAKDHPIAKSLTKTWSTIQSGHARVCAGEDLLGNWELIRFESSYQFKKPRAPYLFPHQLFQYSRHGGAKSAHSLHPIAGNPERVLAMVPSELTYQLTRGSRVVLTARGRHEPVETWSCEMVTRSRETVERESDLQRGDLIMTLVGSGGRPLFVRHLRKMPA